MNAEVLFLIGTLGLWAGAAFVVHSAAMAFRLILAGSPEERNQFSKLAVKSVIIGAVLMVIGITLPTNPGREAVGEGWAIPLVWVVFTIPGWGWFLSAVGAFLRGFQAFTALTPEERKNRLGSAGIWAVSFALFLTWHQATGDQVEILKGVVAMKPLTIAVTVLLAIAAISAMVTTQRAAQKRGAARKVVVQVALLVGCLIFSIPFAWMLSTSFKESEDISLADGIRWIPQVNVTHDYMDEEKPLVSADLRGRSVKAQIIEVQADGQVLLEVERPYGLRGRRFESAQSEITPIPRAAPVVTLDSNGETVTGFVARELDNGSREVEIMSPEARKGERVVAAAGKAEQVQRTGFRWQNYPEALEFLPEETKYGLVYLKNTVILVVMSVIGTILSCSLVAYGFSRLKFPGNDLLFGLMLATMMLPAAVTMLPTFLIFRQLGWIDTLLPIWVPTFFAQAFNVFLLRQFFRTIPMELEDAAKIDGCSYLKTYWTVMMPQIKPALAAISIWTFMGAWNNFMGPLIYVSSPENMPIAYALQLFSGERGGEYGLMMAFGAMATVPVVLLFFVAQKWFIEGVQLSGLGGR